MNYRAYLSVRDAEFCVEPEQLADVRDLGAWAADELADRLLPGEISVTIICDDCGHDVHPVDGRWECECAPEIGDDEDARELDYAQRARDAA